MEYGFGPHLMLDCYGCPKERLADVDFIYELLETFPARIGMNRIMLPHVFKYHGQVPDDWGVSGVVLIADSHISIHTFPDKQHAFIDIFSCQDFDTDFARTELVAQFQAERHEIKNIGRTPEMAQLERRDLVGAARIIQ